jgi:hypothetical protein
MSLHDVHHSSSTKHTNNRNAIWEMTWTFVAAQRNLKDSVPIHWPTLFFSPQPPEKTRSRATNHLDKWVGTWPKDSTKAWRKFYQYPCERKSPHPLWRFLACFRFSIWWSNSRPGKLITLLSQNRIGNYSTKCIVKTVPEEELRGVVITPPE